MARRLALALAALCVGGCATLTTRSRSCRSVAAFRLSCTPQEIRTQLFSPSVGTSMSAAAPRSLCVASFEDRSVVCTEHKGLWICEEAVSR